MILTKLKEYAEQRMDLPPTMYGENKIAWYIDITIDGKFEAFIPLKSKEAKRGIAMITPHIGRSSGVKPKLLADTAEYVLGVGREKSKPERVKECHEQFKALIQQCTEKTEEVELKATTKFLNSTELDWAKEKLPDGFDPGDVLTFRVAGKIPANAAENWNKIEQFWANYTSGGTEDSSSKNEPEMTCLITGETTTVEQRLPFKIKGIVGGQASGTALVSANSKAFESYGLKNSLTSPISKDAAEKFANALNFLISD